MHVTTATVATNYSISVVVVSFHEVFRFLPPPKLRPRPLFSFLSTHGRAFSSDSHAHTIAKSLCSGALSSLAQVLFDASSPWL
jgi:hypothetical protein